MRIGMGQMLVEGGRFEANLARAVAMVDAAAKESCDLVVLPECLDCGWTDPSARDLADAIPGRSTLPLSIVARELRRWIVAGVTERDGDRIYNTAVLIDPFGEILAKHRKVNELEITRGLYSLGDRIGVAETPFGSVGLTVCADNAPDSLDLARTLGRMGAQLFPSPCAWAVDVDHDNVSEPYGDMWLTAYRKLAKAFEVSVVGVSNVGPIVGGPWAGRKCIGCSLAVAPGGEILATGPYDEEALVVFESELRPPVAWGTGFGERLSTH